MKIFKSQDGEANFQFEKTDCCKANGSETLEFRVKVKSRGFCCELSNIWFYHDDLTKFVAEIFNLISGKVNIISLNAMSDFVLTIIPVDRSGHFAAKFSLISARDENFATLTVKLESQLLADFASEFKSI